MLWLLVSTYAVRHKQIDPLRHNHFTGSFTTKLNKKSAIKILVEIKIYNYTGPTLAFSLQLGVLNLSQPNYLIQV